MSRCPLCKLSQEEHDSLWRDFYFSKEQISPLIEKSEAEKHFASHRVLQPEGKPWSGNESLERAEKLPSRLQKILLLLKKNPGLSLEQISACLYQKENEAAALRSCSRDLKRLFLDDFVHRVFLENVAGEGPRPRKFVPALFFLGVNSRSYIQKRFSKSPVKKEEWIGSATDLYPWNRYYHLWLSREIVKEIVLDLDLESRKRSSVLDNWEITFDPANWISPISFALQDPLRNFRKIQADGVFALSFQKENKSALLPFFYYLDRGSKTVEQMMHLLSSHAALPRSKALAASLQGFSPKTIAPVLCVTESPERRDLLLQAARGSMSQEASILVGEKSSFAEGIDRPSWQNIFSGEAVSLLKAGLLVAGSSGLPAGSSLEKKI